MESHLLQMRGLKLATLSAKAAQTKSHLLQMRGLKLPLSLRTKTPCGRIFYRCVD